MDDSHSIGNVDVNTLHELLTEYPDVVPEKLSSLDQQRYERIPRALGERKQTPHLTKSEVATLVDWKLYAPLPKEMVQLLR